MGVGFDTQTATEWLCKSAHQGNADAMFELGRIYLSEISRTPAPGQKLRRTMTAKERPALAHMWLAPGVVPLLYALMYLVSFKDSPVTSRG